MTEELILEPFPNEVLVHHILPWLKRDSIIALKASAKDLFFGLTARVCVSAFTRAIELRLSEIFGDHLPVLYKFLSETRGAITGSVILEVILGDTYPDRDLDIVIPESGGGEAAAHAFAASLGITLELYQIAADDPVKSYDSLGRRAAIESIYTGRYRDERLQFITSNLTALEHIALYDFSAVRNTFQHRGGVSSLELFDLPAIFNRLIWVKYREDDVKYRLDKYVHRGFRLPEYEGTIKDFGEVFELHAQIPGHRFTLTAVESLNGYTYLSNRYQIAACDPGRCITRWLRYPHRHIHLVDVDGKEYVNPMQDLKLSRSNLVIESKPAVRPEPVSIGRWPYLAGTGLVVKATSEWLAD